MVRLAVIALALVAFAVPAPAAVADGLAAPYLHIQVALANDSTDGVAGAHSRFPGAVQCVGKDGL